MPETPYLRLLARRASLQGGPADLEIPCIGSGALAYHRVRERFLDHALCHPASGFRATGEVDELGRGAIEEEHPFGGSVIEGYHQVMTVVLDAAVLECRTDGEYPDAPTSIRIWCAAAGLRAELEACVLAAIAQAAAP